jgi:hypothetical protein
MCLVYYCNKYEIIVYIRILYNILAIYSFVYIFYIFKLFRTERRGLCLCLHRMTLRSLPDMFDNRELYLDIIIDHRVSAIPKRYSPQSLDFDGLFTVGRAGLEFTHSWRDHMVLLFIAIPHLYIR